MHRNLDSLGAVLALEETSERGGLDQLLAPAIAAVSREQISGSTLLLVLIVIDLEPQC